MARYVIVSAGPVSPELAALVQPEDTVIACDAGWKNCEVLGLVPDLVVGDFDSAPQPQAARDMVVLPHVKDDTDTHYAVKKAAALGADEVLLLGALGGARMEHTLGNLASGLWLEQHGVRAALVNEKSRVTFVRPGERRAYLRDKYFYLSVFPLEGRAEGVDIAGAYYPLCGAALEASYPLGVSNEFVADTVYIHVETGYLLVVETLNDQ